MTEQSLYCLESFVPSWLIRDAGYIEAYRDRIRALMEMQDYAVDEITMPFVVETPDCPAVPGMCVFRVEAIVREYDVEVPMDDDGDDDEWTPITQGESENASVSAETLAMKLSADYAQRRSQED